MEMNRINQPSFSIVQIFVSRIRLILFPRFEGNPPLLFHAPRPWNRFFRDIWFNEWKVDHVLEDLRISETELSLSISIVVLFSFFSLITTTSSTFLSLLLILSRFAVDLEGWKVSSLSETWIGCLSRIERDVTDPGVRPKKIFRGKDNFAVGITRKSISRGTI